MKKFSYIASALLLGTASLMAMDDLKSNKSETGTGSATAPLTATAPESVDTWSAASVLYNRMFESFKKANPKMLAGIEPLPFKGTKPVPEGIDLSKNTDAMQIASEMFEATVNNAHLHKPSSDQASTQGGNEKQEKASASLSKKLPNVDTISAAAALYKGMLESFKKANPRFASIEPLPFKGAKPVPEGTDLSKHIDAMQIASEMFEATINNAPLHRASPSASSERDEKVTSQLSQALQNDVQLLMKSFSEQGNKERVKRVVDNYSSYLHGEAKKLTALQSSSLKYQKKEEEIKKQNDAITGFNNNMTMLGSIFSKLNAFDARAFKNCRDLLTAMESFLQAARKTVVNTTDEDTVLATFARMKETLNRMEQNWKALQAK